MFSAVDTIWVLVAAVLVFFMQAGFAMVETGFARAKNAGNIIMKNLMDFAVGTLGFWLIGFGLMFAGSSLMIGGGDFFVQGNYDSSVPTSVFLIFQTVFCATAATIVSGAMAERTKFSAYLIYSAIISALVYPISGHWIWGGGWLAQLGFHDLAGSTAIHMVGGIASLVGAAIVGPRIGKYGKDGKINAIPGHSITLGALGVFILWFAWFGFNGGSVLSMTGDASILAVGHIFVTTNLAAAASTVIVMLLTWLRYKKPDISMTLNGSLGGLVAITAGADVVSPVGAVLIGLIAGIVMVFAIEFIDKKLRVDDPVGAIGVHGCCGALGTLLVGLFALDGGLFYGGGFQLLGIQTLGVLSVALWVVVTMSTLFILLKKTIGLRVSRTEELAGLDVTEHGLDSSYADFMPVLERPAVLPEPVPAKPVSRPDAKLTKVVIITSQAKFDDLKAALDGIGITGMTVTHVIGYGLATEETDFYRGLPLATNSALKVKIEIVVSELPVSLVVDTAKRVLHTGKIGDGKIFIEDVENVIRIRTGEEGYDALQY